MIGPNCKETRPKGGALQENKKRKSKEISGKRQQQGGKRRVGMVATKTINGGGEGGGVGGGGGGGGGGVGYDAKKTTSISDNKLRLVKKSRCLLKTGDKIERITFDSIEMRSLDDDEVRPGSENPGAARIDADFGIGGGGVIDENTPENGEGEKVPLSFQNKSFMINSKKIDELIDEMESMADGLNFKDSSSSSGVSSSNDKSCSSSSLHHQGKEEEIIEEFLDISQCRIIHDDEGNFDLINEQELNCFTAKDYYDYILGYEQEQEDLASSSSETTSGVSVQNSSDPNLKSAAPLSSLSPETETTTRTLTEEASTSSTALSTSSPMAAVSPKVPEQSDDLNDSNFSWLLNFKVASIFDPNADPGGSPKKKGTETKSDTQESGGKPTERSQAHATKPPFTYTELIDKALKEKGQLTVSNIYSWISERYPFYRPNDDRWKNSVRHNLSINPHFRKGNKAPHGAGHFWILSNSDVATNTTTTQTPTIATESQTHRKSGCQPFPAEGAQGGEDYNWEEVLEATRNIEQTLSDADGGFTASLQSPVLSQTNACSDTVIPIPIPDEKQVEPETDLLSPVLSATLRRDPTLHQTAGDILNGIKKRVEVQYLQPVTPQCNGKTDLNHVLDQPDDHDQNFFNSCILKEIDGSICLLERENDYLMSDLNETLFNEELNFQSFTLSSHL